MRNYRSAQTSTKTVVCVQIGNPLYESTVIDAVEKGKMTTSSTSSDSSGFSEATPLLLGSDNRQAGSQIGGDARKVAPVEIKAPEQETVTKYKPGRFYDDV